MDTSDVQPPFQTSNAVLAFALHLAGVPWCLEKYPNGKTALLPCINIYDEQILQRLGLGGKTLIEAGKAAIELGEKGHVEYGFQRTAELPELIAAFNEQQRQLEERSDHAPLIMAEIMSDVITGYVSVAVAILRIVCVTLKMRKQMLDLWKSNQSLLRVRKSGEPESRTMPNGGRVTKFPGFAFIPLTDTAGHPVSDEEIKKLRDRWHV